MYIEVAVVFAPVHVAGEMEFAGVLGVKGLAGFCLPFDVFSTGY